MNKQIKSRGFTIVELLIVIVIIAILAAITLVAYNGITARAHSSAAASAAQTVQQKAEAYNAENSNYPTATSKFGTDSTTSFYIGSAVNFGTPSNSTASGADKTVSYAPCPFTATEGNATGAKIGYYKYDGTDAGIKYIFAGTSC